MATSMTGFGASQLQDGKIQISIQIKTLNGRFLETKFRLPRQYMELESQMRSLVSQHIHRGSVEIFLNRIEKEEDSESHVVFKSSLAKGWIKASKKLAKDLKLKFNPSMEQILRIPDIYQVAEVQQISTHEKSLVLKALGLAVKNCVTEKVREGEKLTKNLIKLSEDVESFVKNLEKTKPKLDQQLKANFEKKMRDLLTSSQDLDKGRLHQESVYLIERSDIEEEITRLKAHLDAFKSTLSEKGSVGKKLDFLVQEMHREVNTMGAKTQSLEMTESIINAKAFVEKIREQVQNIE